jgi:hypothetical protein
MMPRASEALIMRAERRGGRLILTEVRAAGRQRRGVFRASRDGGRLQLCFFATNASADAADAYAPDGGEPNNDNNNQQQEQEAAPYGGEPCQWRPPAPLAPASRSARWWGSEMIRRQAREAAGRS